ncbi:DUF2989 domain-containing protein [Pseudoalteromonas denitrificans]|jgi:tetratricopeptide (TPR) repeat protein|uniref:DUF2989 domain-containing protein n=1 Tax=Pseudoalteromonas denitrificans DSM 6059 TaxID=1123010 RepID=A0A1I1P2W8_9GAMM|nr:DUF2989 domain-containing protein [Pseudoalteromonas denitrificans]SFD01313.1 Protein of unknown function [Pseudoalteromonas denitrificans DSM 6059]
MKFRYTLLLTSLVLFGCEKQISVREVCEQNNNMCSDLNVDGHCNAIRSEVIVKRFIEKQDPSDDNKYKLLLDFEEYSKCIHLASQIEHIKLKDKKSSRIKGYMTSLREIKRLNTETKNVTHPGLLYYHWTHNRDEQALEQFLALETSDSMKNSEMQFLLATYYIKFDLEKTLDLLYRALELNPEDSQPNVDIYKTLVNIFYKQKKYKHAYIWALIARESGVNNIEIIPLAQMLKSQGKSLDNLEALANKTQEEVESGKFFSPRDF